MATTAQHLFPSGIRLCRLNWQNPGMGVGVGGERGTCSAQGNVGGGSLQRRVASPSQLLCEASAGGWTGDPREQTPAFPAGAPQLTAKCESLSDPLAAS